MGHVPKQLFPATLNNYRHGTGFQINRRLTVPPHENIIVDHPASDDARYVHVESAVKDAVASARRGVDDLARKS
jgi:hypothetical protein